MIDLDRVIATLSLEKVKSIGEKGKFRSLHSKRSTARCFASCKRNYKKSLDEQQVENYFLEAQMLNATSHPHIMPVRYALKMKTKYILLCLIMKKDRLTV